MSDNHYDDDKTRLHVPVDDGAVISHYRIVSKIGAGGMGEVYLAEDIGLNRRVALKFLPQHLCHDEDCRARFKREAQAAAKLDHPNIVTVYEVSDHQGRPFFAMQHVEGRSLREHAEGKNLSIRQIFELGIQICEGLQAAHDAGIIHRDIKPSNILIDSHGRARIVDFGLAAVKGTDHLTKTGSTLGTIGYMSPEQVRGEEVNHRSDLFSVGVVLYELIAGQLPFQADTEAAILHAITHKIPLPLVRYRPDLPEGIQRIINKTLEKDTATRYQSASGLSADLKREIREMDLGDSAHALPAEAPTRSSKLKWGGLVLILVAVVVALILTRPWISRPAGKQPDKTMLAVLPFENLGDTEDEFFADGITHEIISRLAAVEGLGVISRTSAYTYKNTDKTIPQIARELGVEYVLEGTIRWDKSGDIQRVRITPQLIRVSDDMPLWAENYERALTQVFALQADIAERIVDRLGIALGARENRQLKAIPTENLEAYGLYLKGIHHIGKQTVEGFRLGKSYLDQALAMDSGFAHAWAGLAAYHVFASTQRNISMRDAYLRALLAARTALELDDELAEAHIVMGWIKSRMEWNWDGAEEEFRRALVLNPGNAAAHLGFASYLLPMCRYDEAIAEMETALALDPLSTLVNEALGWTYFISGRFDRSIAQFKRTLELDPVHVWARAQLAWAYACKDMYTEAIAQCDTVLVVLEPDLDPWLYASLASVCARGGQPQRARAILESLRALPPEYSVDPICYASLYASLGEPDSALDYLAEAYEARSPQMLSLRSPSSRNFFFRDISADARYQEIIDRMNFPSTSEKNANR